MGKGKKVTKKVDGSANGRAAQGEEADGANTEFAVAEIGLQEPTAPRGLTPVGQLVPCSHVQGSVFQAAWDRAPQHDVQILIITRLRGSSLDVLLDS